MTDRTAAAHKAHETRRARAAAAFAETGRWTRHEVAECRRVARDHAAEMLANVADELDACYGVLIDRHDEDARMEMRSGFRLLARIPQGWQDKVGGYSSQIDPVTGVRRQGLSDERRPGRLSRWLHVDQYVTPHGLEGMEAVEWLFGRLALRDEIRDEIDAPTGRFLNEPETAWLLSETRWLSGADLDARLDELND